MSYFLLIMLLIVAILLVLVVLLQKGRGGGLGAAFGGGGAGSAFGTRTGDVLTWITIALTVLFLGLTMCSVAVIRPESKQVATPVITPDGPISDKNTANISCPTPKASIYFTVDGTDPVKSGSKGSAAYTSGVPVRPGTTLKARAYLAGMKPSEIAVVKYITPEEAAKIEAQKAKEAAAKVAAEKAATTQPTATTLPTSKPAVAQ